MNINDYLTPTEVAKLLKVTRLTVYRWIKEGKLKALKIEGIVRIKGKDLEEFVGK